MKSRFLACAALTALTLTSVVDARRMWLQSRRRPGSGAQHAHRRVAASVHIPAILSWRRAASTTPSRLPDAATRAQIQELLNRIQDAYFDYNKHTLRPDAEAALKKDAQTLADIIQQYPDFKLTVEGFADERGSEEYNLALGDARAKQTKEYLSNLGLPGNQLAVMSYGKDKPVCTEHDEDCWQKNRHTHITQAQAQLVSYLEFLAAVTSVDRREREWAFLVPFAPAPFALYSLALAARPHSVLTLLRNAPFTPSSSTGPSIVLADMIRS